MGGSTSPTVYIIRHSLAAILIGGVFGLICFGVIAGFEEAIQYAPSLGTNSRARAAPLVLVLIAGFAAGRGGHAWLQRSSGLSGPAIVGGLSLLAGAAAFGVAYPLANGFLSIDTKLVLLCTALPVATMIVTACVLEWLDQ